MSRSMIHTVARCLWVSLGLTAVLASNSFALVQGERQATTATTAAELLQADSTRPVDRIPAVERIQHWQALDNRHVLLELGAGRSYVLTLAQNCHQLSWAQTVDVSRSGSDIWAQFDYVAADGWRCNIGAIHRLGNPLKDGI